MIRCFKCDNKNPSGNYYCLKCGKRLPTFFERWHKLILGLWVVAIGFLLFMLPEYEPQLTNAGGKTKPTQSQQKKELPPEIDPNAVYRSEITMPDGSTGIFDIYLLDKRYVWATGSETIIEGLGDLSVKGAWKSLFSEQLQNLIKNANEILVVGTADIRNKTERENARAGNRSRTLLSVVTDIRENGQTAFNWNLGQWKGATSIPFEDQRRVIFIEIVRRSAGMELKDGVRRALEENQAAQPIFRDMLNSYTKSDDFEIR